MKFRTGSAILAIVIAAAAAVPAAAQTFSGLGDPASAAAFAGGFEQVTFAAGNQTFTSYTEAGVTFGPGRIGSTFAGNFNTTGSYLDNNAGANAIISFSFDTPTSAFAFNWGAGDVLWNVELFSGASAIGSYALTPTFGSNAKEYFGFAGSNITSARISHAGGDWVFIDNLTYTASPAAAVPEPGTWAMLIAGFGLVGAASRRRQTVARTI